MSILVPVSTSDKVVSFSDHARYKAELGELNYEQFCNIEMLELGYSPSNPKDVLEYKNFINVTQLCKGNNIKGLKKFFHISINNNFRANAAANAIVICRLSAKQTSE